MEIDRELHIQTVDGMMHKFRDWDPYDVIGRLAEKMYKNLELEKDKRLNTEILVDSIVNLFLSFNEEQLRQAVDRAFAMYKDGEGKRDSGSDN